MPIDYVWRGEVDSDELEALHAEGFERDPVPYDWRGQLQRHSLGWVTARDAQALVGFVNVAWDGGIHAFLLDTLVARTHRRQGIGTMLVRLATDQARAAGMEWLHVDFDAHLAGFYLEDGGFTSALAGTIALR